MGRVPKLDVEGLSPEQLRVHGEIAGPRGGIVDGPFAIWLRNTALADPLNQAGNALRVSGGLDRRLFELMVLVVARFWSAQYEWSVHERAGLKAGLSPAVVQAVQERRLPEFMRDDERLVYGVVTELNETKALSQATYDRALAGLGVDFLIELITAAGFYTMVAMVLNAFDVEVPDGTRPLP